MTENNVFPDSFETLTRYLDEIVEFTSAEEQRRQEARNTVLDWIYRSCKDRLDIQLGTVNFIFEKDHQNVGCVKVTVFDRERVDLLA